MITKPETAAMFIESIGHIDSLSGQFCSEEMLRFAEMQKKTPAPKVKQLSEENKLNLTSCQAVARKQLKQLRRLDSWPCFTIFPRWLVFGIHSRGKLFGFSKRPFLV